MFRTKYSEPLILYSNPGSRIKVDLIGEYDTNGEIVLTETGVHDWYEEIQSHRASCDLQLILKRFLDGDESALSRRQGMYGDFTSMPKTYMDMLNMSIKAEQMFAELPIEIKQKFNNNFALWLNEVNTSEWLSKMGLVKNASEVSDSNVNEPEVSDS